MYIEGFDLKQVQVGMATGPLGDCPFCQLKIQVGQAVAAQEDVFTSHEPCLRQHVEHADHAHELAHDLSARLLQTIDEFVGEHGGMQNVSMDTALLGVEQLSSVWRRLAKKAGVGRHQASLIQQAGIDCAKGIAQHMMEHDGVIPGTLLAHGITDDEDEPEAPEAAPAALPMNQRVALGNAFGSMTTRALSGSWSGEPEEC